MNWRRVGIGAEKVASLLETAALADADPFDIRARPQVPSLLCGGNERVTFQSSAGMRPGSC